MNAFCQTLVALPLIPCGAVPFVLYSLFGGGGIVLRNSWVQRLTLRSGLQSKIPENVAVSGGFWPGECCYSRGGERIRGKVDKFYREILLKIKGEKRAISRKQRERETLCSHSLFVARFVSFFLFFFFPTSSSLPHVFFGNTTTNVTRNATSIKQRKIK